MVRTSFLTALCIILIGFGVPTVCIYFSVFYGFNVIVAGLIALLSLIVAGILAIIGIAIGSEEVPSETLKLSEREKLNLLRAHQRATLEELDDIIEVLREIKDVLKSAQE
ncbi:MAG: hypothetical protein QME50_04810 [Candidatus Bathyarchaeota archaeon]|nr:hypothetical protein [Candidatus Bathyarchaeota archaeon]MDI6805177.1 hypothetical protein [Candidatus Bathyarchaeia archaeon]